MLYQPNVQTVIFVVLFLVVYEVALIFKTLKHAIDLYDFLFFSSLALAPAFVVVFPGVSSRLAQWAGVRFPMVLLFGGLFLLVFLYLYRILIRLREQERRLTRLAQELALSRAS